jgi:hypothetical protein
MRGVGLYLSACLIALGVPRLPIAPHTPSAAAFPGWPTSFQGQALSPIPFSDRDRRFAAAFPGRVQTFSDGRRTFILRFVDRATRRLHPARDCFLGAGYEVRALPPRLESDGAWAQYEARRGATALLLSERVQDDSGGSWSDVSGWYWSALLNPGTGPWWSTVVIEPRSQGSATLRPHRRVEPSP